MARVALYAGSFDPMTNGHLDVIKAGLCVVDRLVIAIGIHHAKNPLFSFDERVRMIKAALAEQALDLYDRVDVIAFDNLLVDRARDVGANVLIRGLRDGTDFDYEMQIAAMNHAMAPHIQTIFVPANARTRTISATLIRQIAALGGDIRAFVPASIANAVMEKYEHIFSS